MVCTYIDFVQRHLFYLFSRDMIYVVGEAHIGLTRFFKSNKANAPPPQIAQKAIAAQPKSIGLSKRSASTSASFSTQDSSQGSQAQEPGGYSNASTGIGDGQSYVNPELFRQSANNVQRTGTVNKCNVLRPLSLV